MTGLSKNDGSMFVRKALGQQLISRDTALAICRMVVTDIRGAAEAKAQEPFVVDDAGDAWRIQGSVVLKPDAVPGDPSPAKMLITKFDGTILSYFD
ncbi:hypothetical protein DFR50_107140 [Roseiarcus fermentans]|uniref:Uncharacterized protein n=1 Tax=Roseiarcus fermentans TaxID=1473586 RepID=A0A366FP87_9HYPH|nr:hypothetical protein [Roseiarcus fermentans]RBP15870.1 hypothetical protein DFR50_107140 [Roseiarcus fermentans]